MISLAVSKEFELHADRSGGVSILLRGILRSSLTRRLRLLISAMEILTQLEHAGGRKPIEQGWKVTLQTERTSSSAKTLGVQTGVGFPSASWHFKSL